MQVAPPWFPVPPTRYGGIELVVAGLCDGMVERGHDVLLFASGGSESRAEIRSPYAEAPSAALGDVVVELPHALAAHAARHEVDLVHDHTIIGAALAAVASGPPVVHTLHSAWSPSMGRLYSELADRVHLVAISEDQASRAPAGVHVAGIVHNGIPVEDFPFSSVRSADGHLAFLGRAGHDKGADVAVDVAARTGLPLRMAVKVNEADERRWWSEVMEPRLDRCDARVNVVFNATHDQKIAVLSGARALLCPLRWDEPFGLMMVEANACGTPVVAWDRGAAREVVAHGLTGLLVAPGDLAGLCDAVREVDQLDRRDARLRAMSRFSRQRMVDGYLHLFREVLGGTVGDGDGTTRTIDLREPVHESV